MMGPNQLEAPRSLVSSYLLAKLAILNAGFESELSWQERCSVKNVDESTFLRESAWVVLSSGMRESVIRKLFPAIEEAFGHWQSVEWIVNNADSCIIKAMIAFGHKGKIEAIVTIAKKLHGIGLPSLMIDLAKDGPDVLRSLPFLGPATSRHLAKNLGIDVAKPDRHLVRVAEATGFSSPAMLCECISRAVGDSVAVVDLVIWRFATIYPHYKDLFSANYCDGVSSKIPLIFQPA